MSGFPGGLFNDGRMFRRALIVAGGIIVASFAGVQSLVVLLKAVTPDQGASIAALPPQTTGTRTYTVTRSVLDDPVMTGSIPRPQGQRVDPCGK